MVQRVPGTVFGDIFAVTYDGSYYEDIRIPVLVVGWSLPPDQPMGENNIPMGSLLFSLAFRRNETLVVRLGVPDRALMANYRSTINISVATIWYMMSFGIVVVALLVWRLLDFIIIEYGGLKLAMPLVCLGLHLLAILEAMVVATLRLIVNWRVTTILQTQPYFFSLSAQFVLAFYWLEIVLYPRRSRAIPFVNVLKIPCALLVLTVLIWELLYSIYAAIFEQDPHISNRVAFACYMAAYGVVVLLLCWGAGMLLFTMAQARKLHTVENSKQKLKDFLWFLLVFLGSLTPAILGVAAFALLHQEHWRNWEELAQTRFVGETSLLMAAFMSVVMFQPKVEKERLQQKLSMLWKGDTMSTLELAKTSMTSGNSSSSNLTTNSSSMEYNSQVSDINSGNSSSAVFMYPTVSKTPMQQEFETSAVEMSVISGKKY